MPPDTYFDCLVVVVIAVFTVLLGKESFESWVILIFSPLIKKKIVLKLEV